jgi:hypothetical protein
MVAARGCKPLDSEYGEVNSPLHRKKKKGIE